MIHYLVSRYHLHTLRDFLEHWAHPSLRDRIHVLPYQDLPRLRRADAGAYIFSDVEHLSPTEHRLAGALADRLREAGEGFRVLNHPRRVLTRYPLLRTLHERNINRFTVHRYSRSLPKCQFPVFLRRENAHTGNLTDLLHDSSELRTAGRRALLRPRRYRRRDLLVVEYVHTGDAEGMFRKYGVLRVGDQILPRHVLFNTRWMTKTTKIVSEETAREELKYMEQFPHAQDVRNVFDLGGIDFGRIDYGLLEGRIQVWEINTNPVLVLPPHRIVPERSTAQARASQQVVTAFDALDADLPRAESIPLFTSRHLPLTFPVRVRDAARRPAMFLYRRVRPSLSG